jgi:hypothetical protein
MARATKIATPARIDTITPRLRCRSTADAHRRSSNLGSSQPYGNRADVLDREWPAVCTRHLACGCGLGKAQRGSSVSVGPAAAGRLFVQMLGAFAEFEREVIIDRVIAGMERKAANGEWTHGSRPYGYLIDPATHRLALPATPTSIGRCSHTRMSGTSFATSSPPTRPSAKARGRSPSNSTPRAKAPSTANRSPDTPSTPCSANGSTSVERLPRRHRLRHPRAADVPPIVRVVPSHPHYARRTRLVRRRLELRLIPHRPYHLSGMRLQIRRQLQRPANSGHYRADPDLPHPGGHVLHTESGCGPDVASCEPVRDSRWCRAASRDFADQSEETGSFGR